MNKLSKHLHLNRQQGTILIVALVMLTAVTIIGVAGVRSTSVEEKMASNLRDRALAFNAAEATLKRGMQFFIPLVGTTAFIDSGTYGQYSIAAEPDIWNDATWGSTNSKSYTESINSVDDVEPIVGVKSQPRYIMRYLGEISTNKTSLSMGGGYGSSAAAAASVSDFSIIARGTGGSDDTVVILRGHYGKRL